ncbi:serine hydrolase [Novosphingobium sp. PS1R-30]|uniref:Serine hydrolase n=1 Tax=Novosphingobium anseongense TaxID=3133436 RepID=A0ABU8RS64_9SPHN
MSSMAAAQQPASTLDQRVTDIVSVLLAREAPERVFAPPFLIAVPPAQLADLVGRLEAANGALRSAEGLVPVTPTSGRFTLRFEKATAVASFSIEPRAPGRVTGLRIGSAVPLADDARTIAADFAALPGRSGFALVRLGQASPIAAAHADSQFAIGSVFKLWVLDALAEDVAAGRHRWDEVVRLGPRSLPSGVTQDWPADAPVTVETLATLMISMSDNTATDVLIGLVGRERVAARVRATGHSDPARMLPLLTTAESFALKLSPSSTREAYARADEAGQARILAGLDTEKILADADLTALDGAPTAIETIEWFASPADVARVVDGLRQSRDPRVLAILGVAPTMARDLRERFAYVGYKGGSEVGVISLAWLMRRKSGGWMAVTASWNDPAAAVDPQRFAGLAERLLRLAASD